MAMRAFNRILTILAVVSLAGWLAYLETDNVAEIIGPIVTLAAGYVGIKGRNSD
jgi:hypothetical protein